VEARHVDIPAARLGEATPEGGCDAGYRRLDPGAVERRERHRRVRKFRRQRVERTITGGIGDVDAAARPQETARLKRRARGEGERLDRRTAISFGPEGGRAPGRMIACLRLRLDQHDARARSDRGGEAGARHSGADDGDIGAERGHAGGGYVLLSMLV
jgi:hypothetical protein